eukprot:m.251669 g.251669  ORF g.251669 m.251669 type:complete len:52 (+) comp40338_c0_seq2:950-1105(+)
MSKERNSGPHEIGLVTGMLGQVLGVDNVYVTLGQKKDVIVRMSTGAGKSIC